MTDLHISEENLKELIETGETQVRAIWDRNYTFTLEVNNLLGEIR
jgi:hypothetical protein